MANFAPQVCIEVNPYNKHKFTTKIDAAWFKYKTYRKLKADLKRLMKEYNVYTVSVSRSRRGEWGEWFEYWHLHGDKLTKGKEGWM